ncbi:MAG: hypothetical protein ACPG6V_09695 [Flavobacteriales bacterium]
MANKFRITTSAYNEILATIGSKKAETGGMLFGSRDNFVVTRFVFDKDAKTTSATYSVNTAYINPMITKLWEEEGLESLGFIHSHPRGYDKLSPPDKAYLQSQFRLIPVDYFLAPIVFSARDGAFKFFPFIYHKDQSVELADLEIVPDNYLENLSKQEVKIAPTISEHSNTDEEPTSKTVTVSQSIDNRISQNSSDTKQYYLLNFIESKKYQESLGKLLFYYTCSSSILVGVFFFSLLGLFLSLLPDLHHYFSTFLK